MQTTFEHLLGLPTPAAVAILNASGITDIEVVPTAAPARKTPDERRTERGEQEGYASTRVVAVADDGRKLIVSRFLTGAPQAKGDTDDSDAVRTDRP